MKRFLLVLGLVALARPAAAQLQGMPVYFNPKGGTGLTFAAELGRAASTRINGVTAANKPGAIGGRVNLGLPFLSVGVGAAVYDPKILTENNEVEYSGTAAFKVFGAPLIPIAVSLQAGVGYMHVGAGTGAQRQVSVPIGVGVALSIPTPGASIEPWVAPRIHFASVSTQVASLGVTGTRLGYGLSGGLNFGLPIGLGAHVAADWSTFGAKTTSPILSLRDKTERLIIGVGVHYSLKLPGLPGVPLVPGA